jgi:hypothetical protein
MQQHMGELAHWFSSFGAKGEAAGDAGQSFGESDMWHVFCPPLIF